jgi:hypothetical protein
MKRTAHEGPGGSGSQLPEDRHDSAGAVTLLLGREAKVGHEEAFQAVWRRLAARVSRQPGHLDVTVLRPGIEAPPLSAVVSPFASRADADADRAALGHGPLPANSAAKRATTRPRPVISVVLVRPTMQYGLMPPLTPPPRPFLYTWCPAAHTALLP